MKLLWKTKNDESPRGLYRIYFCAHPDEYSEAFGKIAMDLFKEVNCAIWYKDDPHESIELDMLDSFNLIVAGVSYRFLTEKNLARDVELQYVINHNIPLLPIVDSVGLEVEYAKWFGKRQYLMRCAQSNGEIDYESKLKLYFSERVISNALIDKIIATFDATIFLSYRKKDRIAVKRLMEMIHSEKEFRHIAIWYDEYLSPGEDFSDSIESAIDKSILFVLAMTRNMVNEDNYVSQIEFPMAQEKRKTILPIALESVDEILLKKRFPELPDVLDLGNTSLAEKLGSILAENDIVKSEDPDSTYLMALAYFWGIYTEQNPQVAIDFFEEAAQRGHDESIATLVDIYANGEYREKNMQKAINYQKMLVAMARKKYKVNYTVAALAVYAEAMKKLAMLYIEVGKFTKASKLLGKIYRLNDSYLGRDSIDIYDAYRRLIESAGGSADLGTQIFGSITLGPYAEAYAAVYKLLENAVHLPQYESFCEKYLSFMLALSDDELEKSITSTEGLRSLGNREGGLDAFLKGSLPREGAVTLFERLEELRGKEKSGEDSAGVANCNDSVEKYLYSGIHTAIPIENPFRLLYDLLSTKRIHRICRKKNYSCEEYEDINWDKVELFVEAITRGARWESVVLDCDERLYDYLEWFKRIEIAPRSVEEASRLEDVYERLIETCGFRETDQLLDKYVHICEYLEQNDPQNIIWKRKIARTMLQKAYADFTYRHYTDLGFEDRICETNSRRKAAWDACPTIYNLLKNCFQQEDSLSLRNEFAICCFIWAKYYEESGDYEEACDLYREAADILLSSCYDMREEARIRLVNAMIALSALDNTKGYDMLKTALVLIEGIENTRLKKEKKALCYDKFVFLCNQTGEYSVARMYAQKACDFYRELWETQSNGDITVYVRALLQLARVEAREGNLEESKLLCSQIITLLEGKNKSNPTAKIQVQLADAYQMIAFLKIKEEAYEESVAYNLKAEELLLPYRETALKKDVYTLLLDVYIHLVYANKSMGKIGKFFFYFRKMASTVFVIEWIRVTNSIIDFHLQL